MTPRLYGNFAGHLHKEDGTIFLSEHLQGHGLLDLYTGYLHLYPRTITSICSAAPAEAFSYCVSGSSALIRVGLFFLLLMVVSPYAKNRRWSLATAALVIFCGSGQQEVLGNITNLRWFLDLGATVALLGVFRSAPGIILASFFVIGGTLSDPLSLALLPVALWRLLVLSGRAKVVPFLYIPAFITHVLMIETSARQSALLGLLGSPVEFFESVIIRGPGIALLGESGSQAGVSIVGPMLMTCAVLIVLVVLVAVVLTVVPHDSRIFVGLLMCAGVAFLIATRILPTSILFVLIPVYLKLLAIR